MGDKQLDFNQPLLSVRRTSTTSITETENKRKPDNTLPNIPPLPVYKSELKSGPVRNPGTVPFIWEHSPGRPKDLNKQKIHAFAWNSAAPRLPPGRNTNVKRQSSNENSEGVETSWSLKENDPYIDKNLSNEGSCKEVIEETGGSSSEESDDAYVDALDTLSKSESCYLNCSISGVSGYDDPDLQPSGTFSTDPQIRDLMMGRFLPAAKAMASETPQYSTRKQPAQKEQPRQIKKVSNVEQWHSLKEYESNNTRYYAQVTEVAESVADTDDHDVSDNSSLKVCGFPWLCLQNSFCLLNSVPGMRKQGHAPIYSDRRTKLKSLFPACNEAEKEHARHAVYEHRPAVGIQITGMYKDGYKPKSDYNQVACSSDEWKLDGSSLHQNLQDSAELPHCDKFPQSVVHQEKEFLRTAEKSTKSGIIDSNTHAKGGSSFQELLAIESNGWGSGPTSPVEKTVYIDSVHMIKSQKSNSSFSNMKASRVYRRHDAEITVKIDETISVDPLLQCLKHHNADDERPEMRSRSIESVDSCFLSPSNISTPDVQMDVMGSLRRDQHLMQASTALASPEVEKDGKFDLESPLDRQSNKLEGSHFDVQRSFSLTGAKVADDGRIGLKDQPYRKLSDQKSSNGCYLLLPSPPPLPKSPSESWLKRTLPAVSSRNPSLRSPLGLNVYPRVKILEKGGLNSKWEKIVRTSNVQQGPLPFPEEALSPVAEA